MIVDTCWNNEDLVTFLKKNNLSNDNENPYAQCIIYLLDGNLVGFASYSVIYEKAEINNIMVEKSYRGRHIGDKLLNYMVEKCKICENITLEVRKSNIIAINLYKKYGFKEVAVRKNYYADEDGILMMLEIGD